MKGGLNKLMRNITATAEGKSDFEKVNKISSLKCVETYKSDLSQ